MESIKERARNYALKKTGYSPFYKEHEAAYIEIATEQKAIDIDKACEYLRKEYQEANKLIQAVCDRNVGELINVEASIKGFRKAMKKKV